MHDTIRLERRDIPAVCLVHDRFEVAAKMQAKIMGLRSARIVVIPEGAPGEKPEKQRAKIDKLWLEIAGGLTKDA
jgi:hypothetical protein